MKPHYSLFDKLCLGVDQVIKTLDNNSKNSGQPYPGKDVVEGELTPAEQKHAAGLMRVNHAGEICAQALYQGQSLVSRTPMVAEKLVQAAIEEGDHLAWCNQRLTELHSHPSRLNFFWYAGSFCIGILTGFMGDKWSLGFVAETERQVIAHLENHLERLPSNDHRSQKVLAQMEADEAKHCDDAIHSGATELPSFIKTIMRFTSKIMVKTAYWI